MKKELTPVQIAIDPTSPPAVLAILSDCEGNKTLWTAPIFSAGKGIEWKRIPCPIDEKSIEFNYLDE
jgi:hypothetical protein